MAISVMEKLYRLKYGLGCNYTWIWIYLSPKVAHGNFQKNDTIRVLIVVNEAWDSMHYLVIQEIQKNMGSIRDKRST